MGYPNLTHHSEERVDVDRRHTVLWKVRARDLHSSSHNLSQRESVQLFAREARHLRHQRRIQTLDSFSNRHSS